MGFEKDIENWNGKSSTDIAAIYHRYVNCDDFIPNIIQFSRVNTLQIGATWLLKHHLENGHKIDASQSSEIFKLLHKLLHWESKLHILQCLPYLDIAKSKKKMLEHFLRDSLKDNNKFVRAWAYNGFYVLASQYPEYIEETKQFFEMAMRDEAASVKARIRNIMKSGF